MMLIVGATVYLGGMITRRLLAQGREVRLLVRPGSDYRPLVEAGAAPALGDLRQQDTLDVACRGVDTVITTAIARMHEDTAEPHPTKACNRRRLCFASRRKYA